jgi:hypothetical protein
LEILDEKHGNVVDQYQGQYFNFEMTQLRHFTENTIKLKIKHLEQKVQTFDESNLTKALAA